MDNWFILTPDILRSNSFEKLSIPSDSLSILKIWSRKEDVGSSSDGIITFGGFHIGRTGILQSGTPLTDVTQLGRGDLVFETLYSDDQTAKEAKFDGNLLSNNLPAIINKYELNYWLYQMSFQAAVINAINIWVV